MKKITLLFLFLALSGNIAFPQINLFSDPIRLTTGNNDRNPSFDHSHYNIDFASYEFEFMVFERVNSGSTQVCVSKLSGDGILGSEVYLTNDSYRNINPAVSYNPPRYQLGYSIRHALVIWQSNKFGRESLFGSSYNYVTGWSNTFIVDSSNTDNKNPDIICLDSVNFVVAYESGIDIKYKKYNILSNVFSAERNLTSADNEICSNPKLSLTRDNFLNWLVTVSFEKEFSANQTAIYFRVGNLDSIPSTGNIGDTVAYSGVNHSLGFGRSSFQRNAIYETNRNGNVDVYMRRFYPDGNHAQVPVVADSSFDNINYIGTDYPITDNSLQVNGVYAYLRRLVSGLNLIVSLGYSPNNFLSFEVSNNPLYKSKISLNICSKYMNGGALRYWFVYNKDSVNSDYPSTIYGISFTDFLSGIYSDPLNNIKGFSLSQNHPNPFNPATVIRYSLIENGLVTLKVYDVLGNEIATLVNEEQSPGEYNYQLSTVNYQLASGIYFYKLTAGNYSDTKRMILLK